MPWPKEEIPDDDVLFLRVHRQWIDGEEVMAGFFKNHGLGMSGNWSKYSSPPHTLSQAKNPAENGVIALHVGSVRSLPEQTVEHAPLDENRAHSEVYGPKSVEVRLKLSRLANWRILWPQTGGS